MMEHFEETLIEQSLCNVEELEQQANGVVAKTAFGAEIQITTNTADLPNKTNHINKYAEEAEENTTTTPTQLCETADEEELTVQSQSEAEYDESSSDTNISNLSEMSDVSGRDWKPVCTRPIRWVQKQIQTGANPRELLSQMLPAGAHQIALGVNDMTLWRILATMLSEPPRRQKLPGVNTFEDVVRLVERSRHIIVLTGAGVSVSCGIPDFRSSDGIYARLAKDYPNLPDPQAMFDINYFARDPRPFYKFAREIYPGQFRPSPCHRFIKRLEEQQKLLRNYTQNIDTLEQVAGIKHVIECHGSFSTATCTKCKFKCSAEEIRADIFAQRIPVCPRCQPRALHRVPVDVPVAHESHLRRLVEQGIMKPDIVFFGEGLPDEFHTVMASDKAKCDLLIVIGSSLKVRPVALIPNSLPPEVPQILINREQLPHLEFDVQLLGNSDVIINQLCQRLGDDWKDICSNERNLSECETLMSLADDPPSEPCSFGSSPSMELIEPPQASKDEEDTDTQSVKSFASVDLALRSSGPYSDSGFESSTSSAASVPMLSDAMETQLQQIKTSILDVEPLEQPTSTANAKKCTSKLSSLAGRTIVKRHPNKRRREIECLPDGTYYHEASKAAYVFPGAQLNWYKSDVEDNDEDAEEDEEEADEVDNHFEGQEQAMKTRHLSGQSSSKRHPLLTEPIPLEEDSPTSTPSPTSIETTHVKRQNQQSVEILDDLEPSIPPLKKRRPESIIANELGCSNSSTLACSSSSSVSSNSHSPIELSTNTLATIGDKPRL